MHLWLMFHVIQLMNEGSSDSLVSNLIYKSSNLCFSNLPCIY